MRPCKVLIYTLSKIITRNHGILFWKKFLVKAVQMCLASNRTCRDTKKNNFFPILSSVDRIWNSVKFYVLSQYITYHFYSQCVHVYSSTLYSSSVTDTFLCAKIFFLLKPYLINPVLLTFLDVVYKSIIFILDNSFFQAKYIAECIDEIKQELRQENVAVKANAVNKLNYVSRYLWFVYVSNF